MLDPQLEAAIRERLAAAAFTPWMGVELVSLDDGAAEVSLSIEPHHLNPGGIVHGGVVAGLLDAAIGLALRTRLGMSSTHVTVHLSVNYLRAASAGTIRAKGTAVHSGARTGYGEAELLDADGGTLARANATFLVVASATAGGDAG